MLHVHGDVSLNGLFCDPLNQVDLKHSLETLFTEINVPDISLINWESPVSTGLVFNDKKSPILATTKFATELFLKNYKVDIACMGNNHIGDCREDGLQSTIEAFEDTGVEYFGAGSSVDSSKELKILEVKGKRIGFLSFVGEETNPKIHPSDDIHLNWFDEQTSYELVGVAAGHVDVLVVNLHWGVEYTNYPKLDQIEVARKMVSAGASVIAGQHTHTLQGIEKFEGSLIIYSLGNFIFSGLKPSESIGWPNMCQETGICEIKINEKLEITYEFIPIYTDSRGPHLDTEGGVQKRLARRSKALNFNPIAYRFILKCNTVTNWCIKLPVFLVRKRGGIIPALLRYVSFDYLKLLIANIK